MYLPGLKQPKELEGRNVERDVRKEEWLVDVSREAKESIRAMCVAFVIKNQREVKPLLYRDNQ